LQPQAQPVYRFGNQLSDCMRRAARRPLLANTSRCATLRTQLQQYKYLLVYLKSVSLETEKCPRQYGGVRVLADSFRKRFSALRKQLALFTRHYSICVLFQFYRHCKRECFQVTQTSINPLSILALPFSPRTGKVPRIKITSSRARLSSGCIFL